MDHTLSCVWDIVFIASYLNVYTMTIFNINKNLTCLYPSPLNDITSDETKVLSYMTHFSDILVFGYSLSFRLCSVTSFQPISSSDNSSFYGRSLSFRSILILSICVPIYSSNYFSKALILYFSGFTSFSSKVRHKTVDLLMIYPFIIS